MQAIKYNEKVWLVNLYNKIFINKFEEIVEKIEISATSFYKIKKLP